MSDSATDHHAEPDPRDPRADQLARDLQADRPPPGDWPAPRSVPVCVLISVKNERLNIAECLRHLTWAKQIVVVDSQSTDETVAMAQAFGAEVYQFHISKEGWPKKRNWALEHVAWEHPWVYIMDADEHATPELAAEVQQVVTGNYHQSHDGYWINRRFMFMGRWIKHCGYYPSWNVRLFKHELGRYERIGETGETGSGDNEVHEHVVLPTGPAGYLKHEFLHYAYPDLSTWVEKHNRYSSWEAHTMTQLDRGGLGGSLFGGPQQRIRWIKQKTAHLPCRPTLRFVYHYLFKLGILDGYPGYTLSRLLGWYEFLSLAKARELKRKAREASA